MWCRGLPAAAPISIRKCRRKLYWVGLRRRRPDNVLGEWRRCSEHDGLEITQGADHNVQGNHIGERHGHTSTNYGSSYSRAEWPKMILIAGLEGDAYD